MKPITFTYWLIYQIFEEENELYAYTDNKNFMHRFKEERDMNQFIIVKRKLTREKIHFLTENYQAMYLELFKAKTKLVKNGKYSIEEVSLVITQRERLNIVNIASDYIFSKIWKDLIYDPYVFKNNYLRSLRYIEYVDAYEYIQCDQGTFFDGEEDIISRFEPDYIGVFLDLYSDIMRG